MRMGHIPTKKGALMMRLTRTIVVPLLVVVILVTVVSLTIGRSKPQSAGKSGVLPVIVRVFPADGRTAQPYGPNLVVVICNESPSKEVYLVKELRVVEAPYADALRANVVDLRSGRPASGRFLARPIPFSAWREDYFVRIDAKHVYGPTLDLRDRFILKSGHKYKVQFTYSTRTPAKVGKIRPWKGTAKSKEVIVAVP